jgi:hypothetical protein
MYKITVENLQNLKRKGYTEGLDQLEHTPDIAGIEVRFIIYRYDLLSEYLCKGLTG